MYLICFLMKWTEHCCNGLFIYFKLLEFWFVEEKVEPDESYLGYERWLPSPPKVQKPRSVFNAASLAYIGDCIYEVCLRLKLCSTILHLWTTITGPVVTHTQCWNRSLELCVMRNCMVHKDCWWHELTTICYCRK